MQTASHPSVFKEGKSPLLPYISTDYSHNHHCEHTLRLQCILLKLKKLYKVFNIVICHCYLLKSSPAMVSGPSPGAFDPKKLQVFLRLGIYYFMCHSQ